MLGTLADTRVDGTCLLLCVCYFLKYTKYGQISYHVFKDTLTFREKKSKNNAMSILNIKIDS